MTGRRVTDDTGDAAAFERYVVPEIPVLLRVARSMTRHDAEAEDLVQDTLLRAFQAMGRFDGRHPRAWLLTILRNTHVNRNRKRRPELLRNPEAAMERAAADGHEDAVGFLDDEFDVEVTVALDQLDVRFRSVVDLVDVGGLSYADAAKVLGVPVGTIMSRLHRARSRIRDHLHRTGIAPRSAP